MKRGVVMAMAGLAAVALGAVGGIAGWQWYQGEEPAGERRPAFSLPDLDGDVRRISEWDGEIIVLNFWASWCKPCREEIPRFVELQKRFGDQGVQFLGVAIDRKEAVAGFADEFDMNYPNLHGIQKGMDVQSMYGNEAGTLPYTIVIDRDGFIRHIFPRVVEEGDLAPVLASMAGSA